MYLLLAAAIPVVIFLYLIYRNDTHKEPFKILLKCLLGGAVAIIFTLLINIPLGILKPFFNFPYGSEFYTAFITAGFAEELSKFAVLYFIVWKLKDFDQHYDGIVYAVFVSLGFALIENIMYVMEGGFGVAGVRAVLAIPGHGFFGVIMGYYLSLARFNSEKTRKDYLYKAFFYPFLFHSFYDFMLFIAGYAVDNSYFIILLMISFTYLIIRLWKLGFQKIKSLTQADKEEEKLHDVTFKDWNE